MKAPGSRQNALHPVIELVEALVALGDVAVSVREADVAGSM